jgi:dolichyl-diphosphooligosaccharide--protein glycosyltransferase
MNDLISTELTLIAVDPWFNFRATKYLVQNGFYPFWDWFDDSEFTPYTTYSARAS